MPSVVRTLPMLTLALSAVFSTPALAQQSASAPMAHVAWSRSANIYEVNIRQYTKEGTFKAFARHSRSNALLSIMRRRSWGRRSIPLPDTTSSTPLLVSAVDELPLCPVLVSIGHTPFPHTDRPFSDQHTP